VAETLSVARRFNGPLESGQGGVFMGNVEDRERHAGAAVLSAEGDVLAIARALMIEPREGAAG
jgi:hypothetical protein